MSILTNKQKMDFIRKSWPKAVCGRQGDRWYVECGDGSQDPLIAVHETEDLVIQSAYEYALRFQ